MRKQVTFVEQLKKEKLVKNGSGHIFMRSTESNRRCTEASRPRPEGDTGTRSETITFLAAEPRHFTRHGKPLLVWRSCSIYFCTNVHCTFTRYSQSYEVFCSVECAHMQVRWSELSKGKQAEEQSTAETPALETKATVSPASSDRGFECRPGQQVREMYRGTHVTVSAGGQHMKTIHLPNSLTSAPFLQHPALTAGQRRYLCSIATVYSTEHMRQQMKQHYLNVLHTCVQSGQNHTCRRRHGGNSTSTKDAEKGVARSKPRGQRRSSCSGSTANSEVILPKIVNR